jgi:type IV pilus assembly protein PilA
MTRCGKRKTCGFTILELLIAVAVIGILAAIALPQFTLYRERTYNSAALSDLRNAKLFIESHFADSRSYPY